MSVALWLLAIQGIIGAFDTLYYHEWRARLPALGAAAASELKLHAARDFFYAVLFGTLPWLAWHGRWVLLLVGVLIAEIALTLTDFVVEITVRKPLGDVYGGERITHAVMGILYGAMIASLIPTLIGWWKLPSALIVASADLPDVLTWGLVTMAVGVAASGIRDLYAAYSFRTEDGPGRSPPPPVSSGRVRAGGTLQRRLGLVVHLRSAMVLPFHWNAACQLPCGVRLPRHGRGTLWDSVFRGRSRPGKRLADSGGRTYWQSARARGNVVADLERRMARISSHLVSHERFHLVGAVCVVLCMMRGRRSALMPHSERASCGNRPASQPVQWQRNPLYCCEPSCPRQPRRAASMVAMSIFFIGIIASKARFASPPPAASASVSARGVICQERPQRSLHQPH